jgi:hypothetical protein
MSMTDIFQTIQKAIEGPRVSQTVPSMPVFCIEVRPHEDAAAEVTIVSSLERADGKLGTAHIDLLVPPTELKELAFQFDRASRMLVDVAEGRPRGLGDYARERAQWSGNQ